MDPSSDMARRAKLEPGEGLGSLDREDPVDGPGGRGPGPESGPLNTRTEVGSECLMKTQQRQDRRPAMSQAKHTPVWRLGRWPVLMHRYGLGRLLGDQYVIVLHRGRRTGRLYETAVMTLRRDPETDEVTVVAGHRNADWYRNIRAAAPAAVFLGNRRYHPHPRFLDVDEVAEALSWSRANRPRNAWMQAMFFHWPWSADAEQLHALANSLGGVAFEPVSLEGTAPSDAGPVGRMLRRIGLAGPVEYAFQVLHGLLHPHLLTSGATPAEEEMPLPGDDLVPDATLVRTRAHTIDAPPAFVWSWIRWLGGGRGGWPGWYPFTRPHDPSPTNLPLRTQDLRVGDTLLEVQGPESRARWQVVAVEPRAHLVLHSCRTLDTGAEVTRTGKRWADISWSFVLHPEHDGRTRLLARTRTRVSPAWYWWLMRPLAAGDTVMQRELLAAIAHRAERDSARARPSAGW